MGVGARKIIHAGSSSVELRLLLRRYYDAMGDGVGFAALAASFCGFAFHAFTTCGTV